VLKFAILLLAILINVFPLQIKTYHIQKWSSESRQHSRKSEIEKSERFH